MNTSHRYEILLASVIAARATSFIFSKILLESMDTFALLGIRFLLAFLILALLFARHLIHIDRQVLFSGFVIGSLYFLLMICELTALRHTDSSMVSLLENCAIILVPLLNAFITWKIPSAKSILCALVAMLGVVLLTSKVGKVSASILLALCAALLYAIAIIVTGRFTQKSKSAESALCIGIIQLGFIGIFALTISFIRGTFTFPQNGSQWAMLLMLVIVCTGFGYTLQPVAQSKVSIERSGLFCSINPAIATILGVIVLHEQLGILSVLGILLIIFSIMLPYLNFSKK
ncbi:MAG: DMT family transporter [Treponema sp.]|uniref:DMT family transporter n=1 Tax=Treponema sp. TaxID=166 RepID=UPI0025DFBA56|nr:DMT family transporter [Treponema sp.]MBQ9281629.1 DMT family transporter [Treponema sp.]